MDERKTQFFNKLTKDRDDSANTLEKPSMRGVQRTVVEKYSDQAHFIYELLQNADDVEATKVTFDLCKNKLIFIHDGKRHFSVSNPDTEDEDLIKGKLGDVNSITSIANSNKTTAKIGKFGVGFKAVFQYTSTPIIYDPEIKFQIDRFIVPKLIKDDFTGRKENETAFIFPFNNPKTTAKKAYNDIFEKLHSLIYPLLFLKTLNTVDLMIENHPIGKYNKKVEKNYNFNNIKAEFICLSNDFENSHEIKRLWLFTTKCFSYDISVGFFVNEKGLLIPVHNFAFCFFQTRETTNLNFIIQAPFLLTDSREGIRANENHNKIMIENLSKLAAKSILLLKQIGQTSDIRLINDDILNIIPTDENIFSDINNKNKISFKPFYTEILNVFKTNEIIPTIDGYVSKPYAFYTDSKSLIQLFSNEKIAFLSKSPKSKWVFTTSNIQTQHLKYINLIVRQILNENSFLNSQNKSYRTSFYNQNDLNTSAKDFSITSEFIENQKIEWLHQFYKWINEKQNRIFISKKLPIFLDSKRKAVAAYNDSNELQLFLPFEGNNFYTTVNEELLKNEETEKFLIKLGIKKPRFLDEMHNIIIPKYKNNKATMDEAISDFKKLFSYYKKCPRNEIKNFISLIKNLPFLLSYSKSGDTIYQNPASILYFPSDFLFEYFETKPQTFYIKIDVYKDLFDKKEEKNLMNFLKKIGVSEKVRLIELKLSVPQVKKYNINVPYYTRYIFFTELHPDGFEEIFSRIQKNPKKSVVLWNLLLSLCEKDLIKNIDIGQLDYFFYKSNSTKYLSTIKIQLKTEKWLLNSKSELVSVDHIFINELHCNYDVKHPEFPKLVEFLEIKNRIVNESFTEEQQNDLIFMSSLKELGIIEDVKKLMNEKQTKNLQTRSVKMKKEDIDYDDDDYENENDDDDDNDSDYIDKPENDKKIRKIDKDSNNDISSLLNFISKKGDKVKKLLSSSSSKRLQRNNNDDDDDDFIKPNNNSTNRSFVTSNLLQNRAEIEKFLQIEELRLKAEKSKKYSFLWFKTLLQMESLENCGSNNSNNEISIVFSKIEIEEGTSRTLILKHPNRYIPLYMEELSNIPLNLYFIDSTKSILIEVINVQSYSIRAQFKSPSELEGVDLSQVREAEIKAFNPIFLIEELKQSFSLLDFDDDFNLCENLCENIEFIFGPPGTGKTTFLSQKVLIPFMKQKEPLKILVLTPTNKAADVVVKRIIECMNDDFSYKKWLIRFGTESDESNELRSVYHDKSFDIRTNDKSIIVTTIARFPYDFFTLDKEKIHLKEIEWDFIVFDEASMIPLSNIIYPLYKQKPKKFIVAGDPFQIQPITAIDYWKSENIFSMVGLNSFESPKTRPHSYPVELLTTQYRSVPSIGRIYSEFTYGGVLKHHRTEDSKKKLKIDKFIDFSSINLIKFPVSKFESIYKPRKLQNKSSYQIYSALFIFEIVKFISQKVEIENMSEKVSIGIIAAYRAQTDLIDKLFASSDIDSLKNVKIKVGTIHSFQGDECDIVFAVFNSPPEISNSPGLFLNNKNIINVAISRTKDYLFVLMPDEKTDKIELLNFLNKAEDLCKQGEFFEYSSNEIEKLIWNNENYLENNSFVTSHQLVNVYCKPEKKYEIRCNETAIDVFINDS